MDTSEPYISMCEAAWPMLRRDIKDTDVVSVKDRTGLQATIAQWKPGYTGFSIYDESLNRADSKHGLLYQPVESSAFILWKQDQLQEMLFNKKYTIDKNILDIVHLFEEFVLSEILRYHNMRFRCEDSFEVLWLKCVMDTKYKLEWRNGTWIHKKEPLQSGTLW